VRAAAAARNVEDFFDGVVRAVAPVLRFDVWAGVTVDPATLMNTGGNYRDAVPERLMPRMLDIEYREGDVNLLPARPGGRYPSGCSAGRPEIGWSTARATATPSARWHTATSYGCCSGTGTAPGVPSSSAAAGRPRLRRRRHRGGGSTRAAAR
jgi:hypothetical protein